MKTALYITITDNMQRAYVLHYYEGGGGAGCCGTEECLAKKPLAEFAVRDDSRTDLQACVQFQINELCKVNEALRARIEELEARAVAKAEVTT